jgi:hypothetical protein
VHVTAVDDAPNVTLPATAVAAKVGKPAVALAGLKLVDPDSAFLRGATVTITNVQAGDVLAAVTGNTGLTAVFQNGTLTIRGTASVATYLKVLRSVTFTAAGGAGIVRTLSVTIDDGDLIGDPATRPVTVA